MEIPMTGDFLQGVVLGMALHKKARGSAGTGTGSYTSVRDAWDYSRRMGFAVGQALAAEGIYFPNDTGEAEGGTPAEDDSQSPSAIYHINDFNVTAGADTLTPGFTLPRLIVKRAASYSNVCEAAVNPVSDGVLIPAGTRFELYINTANANGLLRGMETNGITLLFAPGDPSYIPPGRTASRLNPDADGHVFGALGIVSNGEITVADRAVRFSGRPLRDITSLRFRFFLASGAPASAGITFDEADFVLKIY